LQQAQLAVTTYLVDKLALRAGGEKDEDLADTVGVCTLRVRAVGRGAASERLLTRVWPSAQVGHVQRLPPCTLKFDFLVRCDAPSTHAQRRPGLIASLFAGQRLDSLPAGARGHARSVRRHWAVRRWCGGCARRCVQRSCVLTHAFCAGKKPEDDLFDLIDPTKVNKHLQQLMPGLTIKVFRTYNASITLSRLLKDTDGALHIAGKKAQVRQPRAAQLAASPALSSRPRLTLWAPSQ
jgi:DNA topoisomerase-1